MDDARPWMVHGLLREHTLTLAPLSEPPLTYSMPRKLPRAGGLPLYRPRSSGIRCHGSRAGIPGCRSSLGHFLPGRQYPECHRHAIL